DGQVLAVGAEAERDGGGQFGPGRHGDDSHSRASLPDATAYMTAAQDNRWSGKIRLNGPLPRAGRPADCVAGSFAWPAALRGRLGAGPKDGPRLQGCHDPSNGTEPATERSRPADRLRAARLERPAAAAAPGDRRAVLPHRAPRPRTPRRPAACGQ